MEEIFEWGTVSRTVREEYSGVDTSDYRSWTVVVTEVRLNDGRTFRWGDGGGLLTAPEISAVKAAVEAGQDPRPALEKAAAIREEAARLYVLADEVTAKILSEIAPLLEQELRSVAGELRRYVANEVRERLASLCNETAKGCPRIPWYPPLE